MCVCVCVCVRARARLRTCTCIEAPRGGVSLKQVGSQVCVRVCVRSCACTEAPRGGVTLNEEEWGVCVCARAHALILSFCLLLLHTDPGKYGNLASVSCPMVSAPSIPGLFTFPCLPSFLLPVLSPSLTSSSPGTWSPSREPEEAAADAEPGRSPGDPGRRALDAYS